MRRIVSLVGLIVCMMLFVGTTAQGLSLACCRKPDLELVEVKLPTCTKAGSEVYVCKNCGEKREVEKGRTLPHKWVLDHINRDDVDCAVGGVAYYHCERCGGQKNESVPPAEHEWSGLAIPATCTEAEKAIYECSACGAKEEKISGSPLGHNMVEAQRTEPECTKPGSVTYKCSRCGEEKSESIRPTGHSMGAWTVIQQPAGSKPGLKEATCVNCGGKKIEEFQSGSTEEKPTATPEITKKPTVTPETTKKPTVTPETTKKPAAVPEATKNPTDAPEITRKPTEEPAAQPTSAPAALEAPVEGLGVQVYVTAQNVNLRSGPGVQYERVGSIASPDTLLGLLTRAALDEQDGVWFAAKHKGEEVWVSAQFSRAVVGDIDYSMVRDPFNADVAAAEYTQLPGGMDLSNYYLRSMELAVEALYLEEAEEGQDGLATADNWAMSVRGREYVEYITLQDGGYSVYGVEIGAPIREAAEVLEQAGLYCMQKGVNEYQYAHLCSPDSLSIDENGFDSFIQVVFDQEGSVTQILWFPCDVLKP